MANLESWEGVDLVKEELTGDDDDGEFFSANHLLEIGAGTEDEMEDSIPVKMDSCLLCAHTPAVTYDLDGNVIKRERTERELEYSDKQLFLNLCYLLGIRKKTRKLVRNWNFFNDPFPFCEQCEKLMTSVTELYLKLEKLKEVAKDGIRKAEELYLEDDLYGKHDWRYYEFRKLALGEPLRQVEKRKVAQQTTQNNGPSLRPRRSPRTASPVTFVKSELLVADHDEDFILPDEKLKLDVPSPNNDTRKKNRAGIKKLKRRAVIQSPKKLDKGRAKKMKVKKTPPLKEKEARKKNLLKRIDIPSEDQECPSLTLENVAVKNEKPPQENAPKNKGGRPRKHPLKIITEENKEKRREELLLKEKQAYEKRYSLLTKLETMSRSEMSPSERSIFAQYPLTRDPVTGEVTIFAGFGNRFMNKRCTLKFTKLEPEEGEESSKTFKYQCQSCSEIIIVKTMRSILQLRVFRAHFRRAHMGIHKCKLCPHLPFFTTASDLLIHIRSAHGLSSRDGMRSKFYNTNRAERPKNHLKCTSYNQKCFICKMPVESLHTIKFRLHLKSHMSEKEKKDFITTGRRFYSEIGELPMIAQPSPLSDGSLCETCGIFVPGGGAGMKRHLKTNHQPVALAQKERHLCSLCGDTFSASIALTYHTQQRHPNGKPDGPILCKHPTCNKESFETEPSLEEHVSRVHASSEANGNCLMCLKCGRVFTSSWAKKVHGNVHSGEKNFKCPRCSKSFPLKATLTNHLAGVHREGEAVGVFECEVEGCGQVFPCRVYLSQHLRRDHGIYKRKQKKGEGQAS